MINLDKLKPDLKTCRVPKKGSNIITPLCRLSFQSLTVPRANKKSKDANAKKKYGCTLLIPSSFNIDMLKEEVKRVTKETWGEKSGKVKHPFLRCEDYEYEGYEKGWLFIRPTAMQRPGLKDGLTGESITETDSPDVYSGRWCIATLHAFTYDGEQRGVSFGLNNVMLLDHDDPLGGRARLDDEFGEMEDAYVAAKDGDGDMFSDLD